MIDLDLLASHAVDRLPTAFVGTTSLALNLDCVQDFKLLSLVQLSGLECLQLKAYKLPQTLESLTGGPPACVGIAEVLLVVLHACCILETLPPGSK